MTIDDVQAQAFNVNALPQPKKLTANQLQEVRGSALFKYWREHKEVGTPMTAEMGLEDGTTALITSSGRVLQWLGGDDVNVI